MIVELLFALQGTLVVVFALLYWFERCDRIKLSGHLSYQQEQWDEMFSKNEVDRNEAKIAHKELREVRGEVERLTKETKLHQDSSKELAKRNAAYIERIRYYDEKVAELESRISQLENANALLQEDNDQLAESVKGSMRTAREITDKLQHMLPTN